MPSTKAYCYDEWMRRFKLTEKNAWLCVGEIKFRNAVKPPKLVTQAGKHLITQNSRQQNQKSHDNSESGC